MINQNLEALTNFRRTVYGFKILIDVMHSDFNDDDGFVQKNTLQKKFPL